MKLPEKFKDEHSIELRVKWFETDDDNALKAFNDNDNHVFITE